MTYDTLELWSLAHAINLTSAHVMLNFEQVLKVGNSEAGAKKDIAELSCSDDIKQQNVSNHYIKKKVTENWEG